MPSDCFPSTMKQDRHVVPGIKPEETDPRSNMREKKKKERSMYVFIPTYWGRGRLQRELDS